MFYRCLLGVSPTALQHRGADATLIRNVRVFDGERVVPSTDVLISAPAGATVIDGAGKTLVPGFIDSHTHTLGTALPDAAVLGVTTVLDMFTDAKAAADMRGLDATAAGRQVADFRSAGVLVSAPKGHGTECAIPPLSTPRWLQKLRGRTRGDGHVGCGSSVRVVWRDVHAGSDGDGAREPVVQEGAKFFARGEEGRSYEIMLFSRSKGQIPAMQRFTTSAESKEITVPFSAFQGVDGRDLMGIGFVASGTPGTFRLLLDDVRLR